MPITTRLTIFECEWGKVWRNAGTVEYSTFGAGHLLAVEMAKEIERLRERVGKLEAEIAAEDAAHAWVQDAPQPETMCNFPSCDDEGCPCQYWREPIPKTSTSEPGAES